MDNKQDVALVEAVTLRERECASMRRYTVTAAAFAVLIVIGDVRHYPLAHALGLIYACVGMGAISYFFSRDYVKFSATRLMEEPHLYADVHRDATSWFQSPFASTPHARITAAATLVRSFFIAYSIPFAVAFVAVEGMSSLSGEWQSYASIWAGIAWVLLGLAVGAFWDTILWPSHGRARLAAEADIDARQVMIEQGCRWVWWWGWVCERRATAPRSCGDAPGGQSERAPTSRVGPDKWVSAVKAREQEVSSLRRAGMVIMAFGLLVSVLAARAGGTPIVLIVSVYLVAVWLPVSVWIAHGCNQGIVDKMVKRPGLFVSSHAYPMETQPRLFAPDSYGPWALGALLLLMLGVGLTGIVVDSGVIPHSDSFLALVFIFMAIAGVSLSILADGLVYTRYGRPALQDRTGIDPVSLMEESGYRWRWYWGWVRQANMGKDNVQEPDT